MSTPAPGVSRRTLARGAAWSVPAVAVAAAAPAYAASGAIEISTVYTSCKHSGEGNNDYPKAYHIQFVIANPSSAPVTFTLPGLVLLDLDDSASSNPACVPGSGDSTAGQSLTVTVPANTAGYHVVVHYYSNNSANVLISFSYSHTSPAGPVTQSFNYQLSGDPCKPKGIDNDHSWSLTPGGLNPGSATNPVCIPTPGGACPS